MSRDAVGMLGLLRLEISILKLSILGRQYALYIITHQSQDQQVIIQDINISVATWINIHTK